MTQPREPLSTITFVDNYCAAYQNLFSDVRSFEAFRACHQLAVHPLPVLDSSSLNMFWFYSVKVLFWQYSRFN